MPAALGRSTQPPERRPRASGAGGGGVDVVRDKARPTLAQAQRRLDVDGVAFLKGARLVRSQVSGPTSKTRRLPS